MALSNVRWEGLKAIEVMADTLPTKIANQKLRQAFRYALEPTKKEMRTNVPVRTGRLWYSIDIDLKAGKDLKEILIYRQEIPAQT